MCMFIQYENVKLHMLTTILNNIKYNYKQLQSHKLYYMKFQVLQYEFPTKYWLDYNLPMKFSFITSKHYHCVVKPLQVTSPTLKA